MESYTENQAHKEQASSPRFITHPISPLFVMYIMSYFDLRELCYSPFPCWLKTAPKKAFQVNYKNMIPGAGEVAQWLEVLTALPEDPRSIRSTHVAAQNCL